MTDGCEFKVFPLARRVGKVRRVAEVYGRKTGNDATGYWRQQTGQMAESLQDLGVPAEEILRQLDAFKQAVRAELIRSRSETGAA